MVTDPSGMELLSVDGVEHRLVSVDETGRFVSAAMGLGPVCSVGT